MRPVNRGPRPLDNEGNPRQFEKYKRAFRYLIDRIGSYCSYCERRLASNLAVEHVQPKTPVPALELEWDNFLLGCVNCNSTKGDTVPTMANYPWPDSENSFRYYDCDAEGRVIPKEGLNPQDRLKAEKMIRLTGLDKTQPEEGTSDWEEASDRRQEQRIKSLMESEEKRIAYEQMPSEVRPHFISFLVTIVEADGFWSVWMRAFQDFPEVQQALIQALPGTTAQHFQTADTDTP
ncbi:hypothetical protein FUAX_54670 (plasmid) [Fulvitalea axinellae]|uniref:HNH domain-containing protein n=1 Tax=Fulvitalea axinellae TaxID=1182444 RepID=A0AAU9DKH8_9BACT|nr:hypothetical protein FUAX_54670 [Fulvitalea axinellae]